MISALSAGGLAFVGTPLRASTGVDGEQTGENKHSESSSSPQQGHVEESLSARPVEASEEAQKPKGGGEELTEEEERHVQQLKQRDAEVRAHEQAHATVGGTYASSPSYEYTVGPDGKRYATSGEVQIDASAVPNNPEATIRKMDIVVRAALAPAEPSSQDLQVAKQAQATRAKAQAELQKQRLAEQRGEGEEDSHDSALGLVARDAYSNAEGLAALVIQAATQEQVGFSFTA